MSPGPLRLGIVGCGRLTELGYLPALAGVDELELVAVADPDPVRRALIAGSLPAHGVAAHADLDGLLAAEVDAVVVASPVETHVAAVRLVGAAGLPCLVEKPPAPDAAGAEVLAGLDPAPFVGFNRRFMQRQAIEAVQALRPIGDPLQVELEISYRRRSWQPLGDLGDAWLDLGPHLVDLALVLFGTDDATVTMAELEPERALVSLQAEHGSASLHCAVDSAYSERLVVRARNTVLTSNQTAGPVRSLVDRARGTELPLVSSLRDQLRAFTAAARGGEAPLLGTAAQGVRVMRIVDRARERTAVAA